MRHVMRVGQAGVVCVGWWFIVSRILRETHSLALRCGGSYTTAGGDRPFQVRRFAAHWPSSSPPNRRERNAITRHAACRREEALVEQRWAVGFAHSPAVVQQEK